jgi:acyl dehydratase
MSDATPLRELVGVELGPSQWLEVSQERIDAFAQATNDRQWIHVDPERAVRESPFHTTVAHGFLTLSLCVPALVGVVPLGDRTAINYGVDRVRFPSPVPAGSRIRARFVVESVGPVAGGEQAVLVATVEREGGDRPVCVAELVLRLLDRP